MSKQSKDKTTKIISLIILLSALIGYIVLENVGKVSNSLLPTSSNQLSDTGIGVKEHDIGAAVHAYGKGFFHVTKDSVKYITSLGQTNWDEVLNMNAPKHTADSDIIAVAEDRGRNISVFNSKGLLYSKSLDNPIMTFSVNKNGYSCVITQNGDFYDMNVFDNRGNAVFSSASFKDYNIFPIATDISDDNRYLAISLLNINGINVSSEIVLIMLGAESINYIDGMFASTGVQEDSLIGMVKFMDNNNLVFVSNDMISCGIIQNNRYEHKWDLELTNKLDFVKFNGGNSISVAYGEPLINKESFDLGTVHQYSLNNELLSSYETSQKVTYLSSDMDATIIGNSKLFRAVNKNGGMIWSYSAIKDVNQLVFLENTNKAVLVSNTDTSVMRVQRVRTDTPLEVDESGVTHEIEITDIEAETSDTEEDMEELPNTQELDSEELDTQNTSNSEEEFDMQNTSDSEEELDTQDTSGLEEADTQDTSGLGEETDTQDISDLEEESDTQNTSDLEEPLSSEDVLGTEELQN